MTHILLNINNFDEPWAYGTLENFLNPDTKVLILPLSYDDGWINDAFEWKEKYGRGSAEYKDIVRPFRSYGIKERSIRWINYYEDDHESCVRKISEADVLFFTGGYPGWMLQRLYDLGIMDAIREFDGIIMGTSAGAMIQLDEFHLTPEEDYEFQYYEGLGLLSGFDIDVHYEENLTHIEAIIRTIEDTGRAVICMPNQGGVFIDGDHFELLGGSFVLDSDDLDELYGAYDALRTGNYI